MMNRANRHLSLFDFFLPILFLLFVLLVFSFPIFSSLLFFFFFFFFLSCLLFPLCFILSFSACSVSICVPNQKKKKKCIYLYAFFFFPFFFPLFYTKKINKFNIKEKKINMFNFLISIECYFINFN